MPACFGMTLCCNQLITTYVFGLVIAIAAEAEINIAEGAGLSCPRKKYVVDLRFAYTQKPYHCTLLPY